MQQSDGHQHDGPNQQQQQQQQEFERLAQQLLPLSYGELQQLAADAEARTGASHAALSASFLFWLAAEEKRAQPKIAASKQQVASLAAQLVSIKEAAAAEASRRQLPPLASSLAYANFQQWQSDHPRQSLPDVAPGVGLPDLLRAAEREEAKLPQWAAPQRAGSSLDTFAANSGYGQAAAEAMARARARLMGYDDDDTLQQRLAQQQQQSDAGAQLQQPQVSPAAERVLDELLHTCCCREERATLLPEAFVPPGLEVSETGSAGSGGGSSSKARIVTTPQRLLEAIAARSAAVEEHPPSSNEAAQQLASGEAVHEALVQLQEDVVEYDVHVFQRMSQRDRLQGGL